MTPVLECRAVLVYLGRVQFLLKQVAIQRCHGAVHGTSSSQPRLVSPIDTIGDTQYGIVFLRTDCKAIGNRFTYVHSKVNRRRVPRCAYH